uniref:Uncharacterized protein n=1 Tax=Eptatretus burgeri TaxID=7764 RepID=A0A8C4R7J5_EPTBU
MKLHKGQLEKEQKQTEFLNCKTSNYKEQITAAKEQLTSRNMDPSLFHESLLTLLQELSKLTKDIVPLKAKLQSFQDIPPNLMLARVKVEEARRELVSEFTPGLLLHLEQNLCDLIQMSSFPFVFQEALEKEVEMDFSQL